MVEQRLRARFLRKAAASSGSASDQGSPELFVGQRRDSFVNALVPTAYQYEVRVRAVLSGDRLHERPAARSEEHDPTVSAAGEFDGPSQRLRLQNHAGTTAKRAVVYGPMCVRRKVAGIHDAELK